ncbi:MAG: hypothetical protein ACJZ7A_02855 [Opitutales bacterium]
MRSFVLFFLLLASYKSHAFDPNALHPFTDLDGRTLEAKFIGSKGDSITIEWNGKTFDLPLASLDAETRALAGLLARSQPQPESEGEIRDWTDKDGRTIQAKFVEADEHSLTLDWNGKISKLPMSMFSAASRELANQLRQSKSSEDAKAPESVEMDVNGKLDLQKEYPWQNKSGQTVQGTFVSLSADQLTISMNRGTREVSIPQDSLAEGSLALAKKLQSLSSGLTKELATLAKQRKKMKVPAVTEEDLETEHEFKNTQGQTMLAQFVEADDGVVTLVMPKRSKTPFTLAWTSFDEESVAQLEALRRKSEEVDSRKPKIVAAKGKRLAYYASGKYKGFNTVFEDEQYAVGVPSTGTGLYVYVKQEEVENGVPAGPLGVLRMTVGFNSRYTDRTDPKKPRLRSRSVQSFDSPPEPSTDREELQLVGTYTNGTSFEFNLRMTRKGLQFWSKIKDPSGEKFPSSHRVGVSMKGVVPKVKDMAMSAIKPVIGDGAILASPVEGKTIQLPMGVSWVDLMKKVKRGALGNLKSVTAQGTPYDPIKIVITPFVKDMKLAFDRSYSATFPLQGMNFYYHSLVKKNEIPLNRALKINLMPN